MTTQTERVTGYTECAPALAYSMMIAMIDAGRQAGLKRQEATSLALSKMRMTSKLLSGSKHSPQGISDVWAVRGGDASETLYDRRRSGLRGMVVGAARAAGEAAYGERPVVLRFPYGPVRETAGLATGRGNGAGGRQGAASPAVLGRLGEACSVWAMDWALAMIHAGVDAGLTHAEAQDVALRSIRGACDEAAETQQQPAALRDRAMNGSSAISAAVGHLETNGYYQTIRDGLAAGLW
ncbi:MAG: hypothetical protein LBR44_01805 [Clostridiales Family XIII bacterium]|jgi:pyrroline-5-carboxylate reductase|nr:hypothetical protein [Clostridiales Family XIII bacterium]